MKTCTLKALVENILTLRDISAYRREHMGPDEEKRLLQKDFLCVLVYHSKTF